MEAASFIVGRVASVTMVGCNSAPFEGVFGSKIGYRIAKLFKERNVTLLLGDGIDELEGSGKVKYAKLMSGKTLAADICIVAIGNKPNTEFLRDSGIRRRYDGSIIVDQYLKTNKENVYAGGDVVFAPIPLQLPTEAEKPNKLKILEPKSDVITHWQIAQTHGQVGARNMLHKQEPVHTAPFFWTVLFGKSFRYTGYAVGFNDIIIVGDLEGLKFAAYYCIDEYAYAVLTVGYDPIAAKFADLLVSGKRLLKSELKKDPMKWAEDQ